MKTRNLSWSFLHRFLLPLAFVLSLPAGLVRAEGSRELTNFGGNRPYLEYRNNVSVSGIPFQSKLRVFVEAGDTIYLGSSAIGVGAGDISFRAPDGYTGTCLNDIRQLSDPADFGRIDNLTEEDAGPLPNAGGYTPCILPTVTAGQEGIWEIDFISPNQSGATNPPPRTTTNNWPGPAATDPFIAAWDITVRNASNMEVPGRAFTNFLALNAGTSGGTITPVNSRPFIFTEDGYIYQMDFNGQRPAGFIFFANKNGFLDGSGDPLFQSVTQASASFDLPQLAANDSVTHKIFFNSPAIADFPNSDLVPLPTGFTWLRNQPADPPQPSNFSFTGTEGTSSQMGTNPLGGNFRFDTTRESTYTITIDVNQDGIFGNGNDAILRGRAAAGTNTIFWDGTDANGNPVPADILAYGAEIQLFGAEVHFPFLDVEQNPNGLRVTRLNQPAGFPVTNPNLIYYDDSGFPAAAGIQPNPLSALSGVDSSGGAHAFGGSGFVGWGDQRGIDTWTLFPSVPVQLEGGITIAEADLEITKTHTPEPAIAGGNITYTITVTNQGPSNVTTTSPATVTDVFTNNGAAVSNLSWTCAIASGSTGTCVDASGTGNITDARLALNAGSTATYTMTGTVSLSATGTIVNQAIVTRPNDIADPDNDDGDTNGDDNRTETIADTVTLTVGTPQLGVTKQVTNVVNNGDGTYTVSYQIGVQNSGNLDINNIQISEDLFGTTDSTFAGLSTAPTIASAPQIVSGSLTAVNANFNGNSDKNLLAGTETLAVGQSAAIAFSVRVTPSGSVGPYNNNATASGTTPGGTAVSDISTNGTNPDANGNGNPGDDSIPTPVTFSETPRVGVAKQAGTATNNGDGTYTIPYTLTVENLGDVPLNNLQVVENLEETFAAATSYTVNSVSSSSLSVNNSFDGNSNPNLLASGNTLAVGQTATITLQVTVTPGNSLGPYNNTASASGTGPGGTTVTDSSNDGSDPDPDGNGDPSENSTPTTISFAETPRVGAAKEVGTPTDNGDRTFTIPYTVVVQNLGDVALRNLQVVENLNQTFGDVPFRVVAIASSDLSVNTNFNGNSNTSLLAENNTLAVGATARITFSVRVTPGNNFGPFNNNVSASGTSPGGTSASDVSTDGTDPDANGNGNPNDDSTPTTITLRGTPRLLLEKRITRINSTNFNEVDNLPNWPNNLVRGRTSASPLPGDEVEYTIYFLSDGSAAANNAIVCDPLQNSQQFILNAFNGQTPTDGGFAANIGIALALNSLVPTVYLSSPNDPPDRGRFYPPGTTTPPACRLPNVRGAVVVELGNLFPGEYGFIRFRIQVD